MINVSNFSLIRNFLANLATRRRRRRTLSTRIQLLHQASQHFRRVEEILGEPACRADVPWVVAPNSPGRLDRFVECGARQETLSGRKTIAQTRVLPDYRLAAAKAADAAVAD